MRTEITPGQTSDYLGFDLVMADNLPEPSVLLADRGYDADSIWKTMEQRNVLPVIPMRKSRKERVFPADGQFPFILPTWVRFAGFTIDGPRTLAPRSKSTGRSGVGMETTCSVPACSGSDRVCTFQVLLSGFCRCIHRA